jgi:hypothetical protein
MSLNDIAVLPCGCCVVAVSVCALADSAGGAPEDVSSFRTLLWLHAPSAIAKTQVAVMDFVMAEELLRVACQKLLAG